MTAGSGFAALADDDVDTTAQSNESEAVLSAENEAEDAESKDLEVDDSEVVETADSTDEVK